MLGRTVNFVQLARLDGYRLIPDGDCFGASAEEVIRVRYVTADDDDVPLIELTAEKCPEQGIGIAPPSSPAAPLPGAPVFGKRRSP
jgi:hypothetical protein